MLLLGGDRRAYYSRTYSLWEPATGGSEVARRGHSSVAVGIRGFRARTHRWLFVFWRSDVAVTLVCIIGFLLALWLVLSTVRQLRPESAKFRVTIIKWISLELDLRCPSKERQKSSGSSRRIEPGVGHQKRQQTPAVEDEGSSRVRDD